MVKDNAYEAMKTALDNIAAQAESGTPDAAIVIENAEAARAALETSAVMDRAESFMRALKSIDPFVRVVPNEPTDCKILANRIIECQFMLDRLYASDTDMKYWRSTEC